VLQWINASFDMWRSSRRRAFFQYYMYHTQAPTGFEALSDDDEDEPEPV